MLQSIALVIHVALSIAVIGLVLIQHGKGADAGAAFGSGASSTVFGARGAASFLTRLTTALAGCFFLTSIGLFYIAANRDRAAASSVTDGLPALEAPAVDVPGVGGDEPATGADSDLPVTGASSDVPATDADADIPAATDNGTSDSDVPEPAE